MLNNRFKENWLLVLGVISLCVAISLYFIFKEEHFFLRGKDLSSYNFVVVAFFAVIFAPVVEELSFRGFYTSKRVFYFISIFLLPVFLLVSAIEYWFLLVLFYLTIFFYSKFKNLWIWKLSIIINVLLFASMHYEINDLLNFNTIAFPFQLAFGFLSIWIVINFNMFKAILVHFAWNAVLMSILFFSLQFPDKTVNTYNNEHITASWSRVSYFNSKPGKFSIKENSILVENLTAKNVDNFLSGDNSASDTYQPEPFMKYNLILQRKDSMSNQDLRNITKEFLEDQNLLIYK